MTSVLMAVTGADSWTLADGAKHPTGFWAEELVEPHRVFREAGFGVTVATPGGVKPTVDGGSLAPEMNGGQGRADELRSYLEGIDGELSLPLALEDARPDEFDLVFLPGGHGPMEDLVESRELGTIVTTLLDDGKIVSAVCHAPAGLLPARRPDGSWVFDGYRLTGFTNTEEQQAGLADRASWLLEDRLREAGATFDSGPAWSSHLVRDRTLHTGQNPASSADLAHQVVDAVSRR